MTIASSLSAVFGQKMVQRYLKNLMLSSPIAVLLLCGLLLGSCNRGASHGAPTELLKEPDAASMAVRMELRILETDGKTSTIGIVVLNELQVPVQSVRAWVRFDPIAVTVSDLSITDGRFVLFAPGEREIDVVEGFVKIGGALKEPVNDKEIQIAQFKTNVQAEGDEKPILIFHDWRAEGDGHTAVLSLQDLKENQSVVSGLNPGIVTNVLQAPTSLKL